MGQLWQSGLIIVFGRCAQKILVFREVPFPVIARPRVSIPLKSSPPAHKNLTRLTISPKTKFLGKDNKPLTQDIEEDGCTDSSGTVACGTSVFSSVTTRDEGKDEGTLGGSGGAVT